MLKNYGPTRRTVAFAMMVVAGSSHYPVRAQFVPGRIFTVDIESFVCEEGLESEYVLELDPETGTTREFAYFPDCPGLRSMAMSPDGKRLRVAAGNWDAILEFDSQGNWEIVIDGSDGVFPAADHNSITYDRDGNFYLSNYYLLNEKVVMFPADGGPKQVLAYSNNNGVIMNDAYGLSVGPDGEVYVASGNELYRIDEDSAVTIFDTFGTQAFINAVLVDDFGYLHVKGSTWYRYELGDPSSREILAQCSNGQGICDSFTLTPSPDRSTIYTQAFDPSIGPFGWPVVIAVDPGDGSFETVARLSAGTPSLAVAPLRGDVDGDRDTDLIDLEWIVACLTGCDSELQLHCDLADMDADEDVDLFDLRYFMLAHTAFQQ